MTLEVTDTNIDETLSKKELTILQFSAEWCGPCKMLTPIIDGLAKEYSENEKVSIGKINVDENSGLSMKYGIRGVPTILFIKDGEVVDRVVGLKNRSELIEKINTIL
jgi:thioredoxin 1